MYIFERMSLIRDIHVKMINAKIPCMQLKIYFRLSINIKLAQSMPKIQEAGIKIKTDQLST